MTNTIPAANLTSAMTVPIGSGTYPDAGQVEQTTLGDIATFTGSSAPTFGTLTVTGLLNAGTVATTEVLAPAGSNVALGSPTTIAVSGTSGFPKLPTTAGQATGTVAAGAIALNTTGSLVEVSLGGGSWLNLGGSTPLRAPTLLTDASGNYTVPAGVTLLRGAMTAGGGGGGGVSAATATGSAGIPGVFLTFIMAVTPGDVIAYTCGAGGNAGANSGGNGGAGGDSTFGTITAKGGVGGQGSTSGNGAAVGSAGSNGAASTIAMITGSALAPTSTVWLTGMMATDLSGLAGSAGVGGKAKGIWSTGGVPGTNGSATDSTGYGGGGSGAGSTTNTAGLGGKGAPGAILLW